MVFKRPSRPDAWRMTSVEKFNIIILINAVNALVTAQEPLANRASKVDGGVDTLNMLAEKSAEFLQEILTTIPENQRQNLVNTAKDYQMRLVPKVMPGSSTVVLQKEEARALVDAAQVKCQECAELNDDKEKCPLFRLLTIAIPLEKYDDTILCPYNMATWEN